jgi:nitroreductase
VILGGNMMDVFEAIQSRRTIGKVTDDKVDRQLIEKILEAGIWAPNHFRTEPWKFYVLTGEGRRPLGHVLASISKETMDDPNSEENREKLKKAEQKPFRAPVVIAVACIVEEHPKALKREELAACHAAVQNMLLMTHALGLGAIWRTGQPTYHEKMKGLFGLKEQDELIGFLYVGHPDKKIPKPMRKHAVEQKTVWIEENKQDYTS